MTRLIFTDEATLAALHNKFNAPDEPTEEQIFAGWGLAHDASIESIAASAGLDETDILILTMTFRDGARQQDIATCVGIQQAGVCKRIKKAKAAIAIYLTELKAKQIEL